MAIHLVIAALLFLAACAALIGVVMAHIDVVEGQVVGLVFGTTSSSLSLLAFGASVMLWLKSLKACCMKCEVCNTK